MLDGCVMGVRKIKVVHVDDSSMVRKFLKRLLEDTGYIEVVGSAENPYEGRDQLVQLNPDVLILDIEMPKMDGVTFLKKVMIHYPTPVIMLSSLTRKNSPLSFKALELGAFAVLHKPKITLTGENVALKSDLIDYVREAFRSKNTTKYLRKSNKEQANHKRPVKRNVVVKDISLIAIGASTGGPTALASLLPRLPENIPGTIIVQHMPAFFSDKLAAQLNSLCNFEVREAAHEDRLAPGLVLIAPGGYHSTVVQAGKDFLVLLNKKEPVHGLRPAVDILFKSVARWAKARAIGALLTGMGQDGAEGLKCMYDSGAYTIAQDEASSVVFGMPKEAIKLNAAREILSLEQIPEKIIGRLERGNKRI